MQSILKILIFIIVVFLVIGRRYLFINTPIISVITIKDMLMFILIMLIFIVGRKKSNKK